MNDGSPRHRVVVVGGGFGGRRPCAGCGGAPVDITLIDRRSFHLFQPLVVPGRHRRALAGRDRGAAAARRPRRRARPRRARRGHRVRRRRPARAGRGDPERRWPAGDPVRQPVVAAGSTYTYHGHDDWRPAAPESSRWRARSTSAAGSRCAFEAAELEPDPERRAAWLTFVVAGAGPTGRRARRADRRDRARDVAPRFPLVDTRPRRGSCSSSSTTACCPASRRGSRGGRARRSSGSVSRCSSARGSSAIEPSAVVVEPRRRRDGGASRPAPSSGPPAWSAPSWRRPSPTAAGAALDRAPPRRRSAPT